MLKKINRRSDEASRQVLLLGIKNLVKILMIFIQISEIFGQNLKFVSLKSQMFQSKSQICFPKISNVSVKIPEVTI